MKLITIKTLLFTGLTLLSFSSVGLKDDANQPINISSKNQDLDLEKNIVTFVDDVVITQGSILIKANKVVITRAKSEQQNKKDKVDAYGAPVTFHQKLDTGKPVDGRANKIHYDLETEFLTLVGNAELKQLDSKINGDLITYDVKKQQLKANSSNGSRVKTVLIPTQLQQK